MNSRFIVFDHLHSTGQKKWSLNKALKFGNDLSGFGVGFSFG